MTESPAGGLPLGFLVLSNHTETTLDAGIEDLKALLPEDAFFGRGVEAGPQVAIDFYSVYDRKTWLTGWYCIALPTGKFLRIRKVL